VTLSCGHDGWQVGCEICEAEHAIASVLIDPDDVLVDEENEAELAESFDPGAIESYDE
jgi:hypothetical protein